MRIDDCKNFNGLNKCEKCGRMMPDLCKDQEELETKAAAYDAWVAKQEPVVALDAPIPTTVHHEAPVEAPKAEPEAPAKKRPARTKKAS